jgi:hypothetical protein
MERIKQLIRRHRARCRGKCAIHGEWPHTLRPNGISAPRYTFNKAPYDTASMRLVAASWPWRGLAQAT